MNHFAYNRTAFANFVAGLPPNLKIIQFDNNGKVKVQSTIKKKQVGLPEGTIRVLTQEGMMVLEKEYKKCKYITKLRKETLAAELNISVAQVTVWFHNRRNYEMRNQHRTRTVPPQQCYIMQNVPPAAVITEPKVEEEEIDIASPSTWGYTSADFGYSFTYNQAKPQVNSSTASTAPTASPSISTDEYDFFADF